MRAGLLALIASLMLGGALPAQAAWMTFVSRDVTTGERLGRGANVYNEDEDTRLAIVCMPDGLTATFATGIKLTSDMGLKMFRGQLSIAADDEAFDAFPVTPESFTSGDTQELRLRFDRDEALGLAEYILGATDSITVTFRNGQEVLAYAEYDNDSAAISIGSVLGECADRS